jgi:putative heme-binding domain-containing protein
VSWPSCRTLPRDGRNSRLWVWLILILSTAALAADSEHQYQVACAPCHGAHGEGGRGPALAVPKLPRAPDDAALASIIMRGIPGTQMPSTRMTDGERQQLVRYVRALGESKAAPVEGDATAGEQLFWDNANCGHCHTVGSRGGRTGPDLTEIALRRSPGHLRATLLDPAANIPDSFTVYRRVVFLPDNFLQVRVVTRAGKSITGLRIDEDAFTIQLRDYDDRFYSFRKDELRELKKDWGKTPMPGYRGVLSETELRDVVAYLSTLRGSQ